MSSELYVLIAGAVHDVENVGLPWPKQEYVTHIWLKVKRLFLTRNIVEESTCLGV